MATDPQVLFEQTVLEMIEHSPVGAVPHTPAYREALGRLYATHQAYASADHKDGHVTARSLARQPIFHAGNLPALLAGQIGPEALEPNERIFERYVLSLPAGLRPKAETYRLKAAGRPVHHRKHHGAGAVPAVHDPVHCLFLVPGSGSHPGLPGNYLYGSLFETHPPGPAASAALHWAVQLHDSDDGAATHDAETLPAALAKLEEVLASAPFSLSELGALGFVLN